MNLGIAVMFTGVAAAMIGAGAAARRAPEKGQNPTLFFASGGLFLLAAAIFVVTYFISSPE